MEFDEKARRREKEQREGKERKIQRQLETPEPNATFLSEFSIVITPLFSSL